MLFRAFAVADDGWWCEVAAEHGRERWRGSPVLGLVGGCCCGCSVGNIRPAESIDLCRVGALRSIRSVSLSIAHVTFGRVPWLVAPAVDGR